MPLRNSHKITWRFRNQVSSRNLVSHHYISGDQVCPYKPSVFCDCRGEPACSPWLNLMAWLFVQTIHFFIPNFFTCKSDTQID